jgi:serine protease Do
VGASLLTASHAEEPSASTAAIVDIVADHQEDCIWVPKSRLSDGPQVRRAFRETVAAATQSTVRIQVDDRDAALGGIVGADGWVLTKASCVQGRISCLLADGREFEAQIVGIRRDHDLAMLKLDAEQLAVLTLDAESNLEVGQWVATPGLEQDPIGVGIISVGARRIPHQPGILGVQLDQSNGRPSVVRVFPGTGAAEAGILINDMIVRIEGQPTSSREQLQREIRRHSPGEEIEVTVRRDGQEHIVTAVLSGQLPDQGEEDQNHLGGQLSHRRFGFPMAVQHDTVLDPIDCGGPIVDLDGRVVGFNIARSGRTESYAIPSSVIVTLLYELMSGNLAPRGR